MKFGIIFYILITIASLLTGIYFFKPYPLFSLIFFIAALVNITFIFKEIKYHKANKIDFNEDYIPEELNIKYPTSGRIINILTYSIFMVLGVFFLTSSGIEFKATNIGVFIMIAVFIFVFFIVFIMEIRKIFKTSLSINSEGIQLNNKARIHWQEIHQEKIIMKKVKNRESRNGYYLEVNYLYFFHNDKKIEVKIDDFDISDYNLAQYLRIYRERHNRQQSL